jgi:anti-anti-sigma factor
VCPATPGHRPEGVSVTGGLSFRIRTQGDTVIVAVAGDVDLASAPELGEELSSHAGGHLVVDLSAVEFLDSTGIDVLVRAYQTQSSTSHTFRTVGETEPVRRVLEIAGLLEMLHGDGTH